MGRPRELEPLLDVRAVAELLGLSPRRARSRLKAIDIVAREKDPRGDGVIVRLVPGEQGKIYVTKTRLRAAFPEHFEERTASRVEVDDLKQELEELKKRQNALAARFREVSHAYMNRPRTDQNGPKPTEKKSPL